ncbi:hypothetical protein OE88DRAFT_1777565 [Heliocybe sulcata]|uniref:Inositol-pentakisphosphate 2-kinase n=1 Tax=Heliocybe sulcata TaxID=5364 RepID=A0A5C3NCS2_9AGAM|nr:hypothetical protein OE88DRAFT_1777565 [Heliocybe sulcata]
MSTMGLIHTISDTDPNDWQYLSEGGATLVLSYRGAPDARFDGMVLRLKKIALCSPNDHSNEDHSERSSTIISDRRNNKGEDEDEDSSVSSIQCHNRIIRRLIPDRYLPRLSLIGTDPAWLSQLADLIQPSRPVLRRKKDAIDISAVQAILATDLTANESWSLEIKPKWGFLPSSTHLSPDTKAIKTRTCRYCMHSYLKSRNGEAAAVTFCPLDLYSGQEERVANALGALWDEWHGKAGHINNLKVFVGGKTLQAHDPASMVSLRHAMTNSSPSCTPSEKVDLRELFVTQLTAVLLSSRVLGIISELQRTLDPLDIEGLCSLWANRCADVSGDVLPTGPEPTLDDYEALIERYLTNRKSQDHDHPDVQNVWYYTMMSLLSGTFKDCSIIIRPTFFNSGAGSDEGQPNSGPEPVTIIDLDRKPIKKLRHWAKLDKEIIDAYRSSGLNKRCVDEARDV